MNDKYTYQVEAFTRGLGSIDYYKRKTININANTKKEAQDRGINAFQRMRLETNSPITVQCVGLNKEIEKD